MRTAVLLCLLLAAGPALAGCIGGDDAPPALGTYELVEDAGQAGSGDHSGHGGMAGLQHTAEAWHFNATHLAAFDHDGEELGVQLAVDLTGGSLLVEVQDPSGTTVHETTATGATTVEETATGAPGSWRLRVTGQDATGTVQVTAGDPAQLGMVQDPPIVFEETLTLTSQAWDHTWASQGNATLELEGLLATGRFSITLLDGMAQPMDPLVLEEPGQAQGTWTWEGTPGVWTITVRAEDTTAQLSFVMRGA